MRGRLGARAEIVQTWSFRGCKSRNKVSVGEPAEGSLTNTAASARSVLRAGRPPIHHVQSTKRRAAGRESEAAASPASPRPVRPTSKTPPPCRDMHNECMRQRKQLLTMDLLALATMKNAANGETSCDLHALRIIHFLNASCACGPAAQACLFEYRVTRSRPWGRGRGAGGDGCIARPSPLKGSTRPMR